MSIDAESIKKIMEQENQFIFDLKVRWGTDYLQPSAEKSLRMGKRVELLGDYQALNEGRMVSAAETQAPAIPPDMLEYLRALAEFAGERGSRVQALLELPLDRCEEIVRLADSAEELVRFL